VGTATKTYLASEINDGEESIVISKFIETPFRFG